MSTRKTRRRTQPRTTHANRPAASPPSRVCLVPKRRTLVSCHSCGYDAPDVAQDRPCPKCGMHSWETTVITERLVPEEA